MSLCVSALPQNCLGEGDSPILLRGLRKIGTVPGSFEAKPWVCEPNAR